MDNKLDMKSKDITGANIDVIAQLFPSCITEQEGKKVIDFEKLKLEFDDSIADDTKEKYELTWPGKREAIIEAKTPTTKTLIPLKEKSVDFENTKNIYIEGDNLEVLKVLQESYLNKIKCIYIDPPYNTGKDFIYKDNFKKDAEQELIDSGQIDELGNKFVQNTETNGRYHSDWLNMMYPRLKLARNLLKEDGVIFISIDDNEYDNLKKLCDEIFGERNFVANLVRRTRVGGGSMSKHISSDHENCLVYTKNINKLERLYTKYTNENQTRYKFEDEKGKYFWDTFVRNRQGSSNEYEITAPNGQKIVKNFIYKKDKFEKLFLEGEIKFIETKDGYSVQIKQRQNSNGMIFRTWLADFPNQNGTKRIFDIFGQNELFSYPKPVEFISNLIEVIAKPNDVILDFFSGSATTAESIYNSNSNDKNKIKYILVQLPEIIDGKTNKTAHDFCIQNNLEPTIPSIAQERIKRAGSKIKEETNADIDYGFRVFKLSDSTLNDNYYAPKDMLQGQIDLLENKFKDGVSQYDILTHIILDLGLTLDVNIKDLSNNNFIVEEDLLYVSLCDTFSDGIFNEIKDISPDKLVLSETSFSSDAELTNVIEKLKNELPETTVSVI